MTGARLMHWILGCLVAAVAVTGCTSDTKSGDASGSLNLNLELAAGVVINEVDWEISGNDMEPMSGTIDTSAPGSTASVEVFGLPPGEDYLVKLEATSEDGEVTCKGSADFDIEVGVTTDVMVMFNCKRPERYGGVRVNGKINICADLAKVVVSPLETSVGSDIDLAAAGQDAEQDDIKYVWSATGGDIADSNAQQTTYTCREVGNQTITITISDDNFEYCMDAWTVAVTCVEGENLCEEKDCNDGNECTDNDCDRATGDCINDPVDDGADCDEGAGMCMNGECVDKDRCKDVDCSDDNECTEDLCDPDDGSCSTPSVDDGMSCEDDAGMCVDGACLVDKCKDVTCEDTGNDCTISNCNMQSAICEEMNVDDGTTCNEGAGMCSNGDCIDDNKCEGIDCTSDNECVKDGMCDPETGDCIPGDNEPVDVSCDQDDGSWCDGDGNCVECNSAGQCDDDGNQCTVSTCETNMCGQANVIDGAACDLVGTGDGACQNGTCVEPPECEENIDCADGNDCTINTCVEEVCNTEPAEQNTPCEDSSGVCDEQGTCVECNSADQCPDDDSECTAKSCDGNDCGQSPVADGTSCDFNGGAGICDGGECVDPCMGKDCDDGNECTDNDCNPETGLCINDPIQDGNDCTGGTCQAGVCEPATTACLECQLENCQDFFGFNWVAGCYEDTTPAEEGPGAGTPKNQLCDTYVSCALTMPAEAGGPPCGEEINQDSTLCYCGPGFASEPNECLLPDAADGPCMTEAEAAAESTNPPTVAERWVNGDYAIGNGNNLLRCIAVRCVAECYP